MTEYIRREYPHIKIILGGYGTTIPNIQEIISYDEICRGEGINWLRTYFGEERISKFTHPVLFADSQEHVYELRRKPDAGILLTGLGCRNACAFCATSHKFNKSYIPIVQTGRELFEICRQMEDELGARDFAIMDENFLQQPERAKELLIEMERHNKPYTFAIFSFAEAITELGIDFMLRLGVRVLWIGVESKLNMFAKTEGIDKAMLIKDLRDSGVAIIASTILFLDHHDKKSIYEDIDWAISLDADAHQFMELIPYPGTALYERFMREGRLPKEMPYIKQHGQDDLSFQHPHFLPTEAGQIVRHAFKRKYELSGPSTINLIITLCKRYIRATKDLKQREQKGLMWNSETLSYERSEEYRPDIFMQKRIKEIERALREIRPMLFACKVFAPNEAVRKKCDQASQLLEEIMGRKTVLDRIKSVLLTAFASIEHLKIVWHRHFCKDEYVRQPPTNRVAYRMSNPSDSSSLCYFAVNIA